MNSAASLARLHRAKKMKGLAPHPWAVAEAGRTVFVFWSLSPFFFVF
jgi:hypothetical protein